MLDDDLSPETLLAHGGYEPEPGLGDVVPPIRPTTTWVPNEAGRVYTRSDDPTARAPELLLARLEGGADAALFPSGEAAATALFSTLRPGDHVVVARTIYYGLRDWIRSFGVDGGLDVSWVDATDLAAVAAAVRPERTRWVWVETPANPIWEVVDLAAVAEIAHRAGARLAVDSTAATPVLSRPLELGADLVMHSATKFLNGHSDVLAGALVTADADEGWQRVLRWRHLAGATVNPFAAWLLLRGMRTLSLRVRTASASALHLATHLAAHPEVAEVRYPGLPDHPGHEVAARQMPGGFGPMWSFSPTGGADRAAAVASSTRLWRQATSLGGVESLIEHRAPVEGPDTPTPPDLLRCSTGIEDVGDLVADLELALATTR